MIEDSENLLHFWFQQAGVDWVLLRPDRYVAALGKSDELEARMRSFCERFVPPLSPSAGIGPAAFSQPTPPQAP